MRIVEVQGLSYKYGNEAVLDSITFSVEKGDLLGIVGPNGAGKTTLFNCMLGLVRDYQGSIKLFGRDIRKERRLLGKVGYLLQRNPIEKAFPASVADIVALGLTAGSDDAKVEAALDTVGLLDLKQSRIGTLSGGQQQRVLIAKAIASGPEMLIMDEPITGIDLASQKNFYSLVRALNRKHGITIILALHDLEVVGNLANKLVCINRKMFYHGIPQKFFANPNLLKQYSEAGMQAHMHLHGHGRQ
ncbi:MAG: metal ABC transporter ATP-binding protein [Candidatus Aenigmarchaeota archaeon]|nr:metal ABC transporter ATP-binding protein [Candidatus Aenigmarchaeota archaeon]